MSRPLLLDGFCKAGGAGAGYHRAGFDVVGVDIEPQAHYPFDFVQADFFEFVRDHGHEFDVIHASPPCQAYSSWRAINERRGVVRDNPELIGPTREALRTTGVPYVIENIEMAAKHLHSPIKVCGSSFGLGVRRHRLFESNLLLHSLACQHKEQGRAIGVYGCPGSSEMRPTKYGGRFIRAKNAIEAREVMGIKWMDWKELTQAIPPAYTEHVGKQLLWHLEGAEVGA